MPDKFKIDLIAFSELHTGPVFQSYAPGTTGQPSIFPSVSGIGSLELVTNFPSIFNKWLDLTLYAKVLTGGGNLTGSSTTHTSPLSGGSDRFDTARSRFNIVGDTLGVEASLVAAIPKTGLTFYGGLFPQEKYGVYGYDYNLLPCAYGKTGEATCPTSISNTLDIVRWTAPLTGAVGPGFGANWASSFGLTLFAQVHSGFTPPINPRSDNTDGNLKRTIFAGQASYKREDKVGEVSLTTFAAASYTADLPSSGTNDKGENLLPGQEVGVYVREGIGPCQIAGSYGYLKRGVEKEEVSIADHTHTLNLQTGCSLLKKRLQVSLGFTGLWYSTDERSSLVTNHTSAPEYSLDFGIGGVPFTHDFLKGFSAFVGLNYLISDPNRQAMIGGATSRANPYLILSYFRPFNLLGG